MRYARAAASCLPSLTLVCILPKEIPGTSIKGNAPPHPLRASVGMSCAQATTSSSDSAGQPATPSPPSTTSSSSAGALTELAPVNLNERGDAHVSFTARALALSPAPSGSETGVGTSSSSPSAPYLLVATDTARVLVLRTSDWSHLANLFGPPVDKFFNPAVAWHRDEHYVYCIGPAAEVRRHAHCMSSRHSVMQEAVYASCSTRGPTHCPS